MNPLIGAAFGGLFPLIYIVVAFIPYLYFIQKIAAEKESKAREGMKMMGLTDSTYYLAWFIVYFVISVVSSLLATAALHICSYARQSSSLLSLLPDVHDVPVRNGLLRGGFPANKEGCRSGRSPALLAFLLYLQAGARSFYRLYYIICSECLPKCLHELVREAHILLQFEHGQWTDLVRDV